MHPARRLAALALGVLSLWLTLSLVASVEGLADPSPSPNPGQNQAPDPCQGLAGPQLVLCRTGQLPQTVVGGAVQFGADQAVVAVTKWVAAGATNLIGEIAKGLTDTTKPNLTQQWFLDHYQTMAFIGGVLMLPFLLASVLQGVIRQDISQILKSAFLYVPMAIFLTGIAVTVVGWTLDATDGMSQLVAQGAGDSLTTFLTKVGTVYVPAQITVAATGVGPGVPLFVLFLGALVTALGAFMIFIELLIRDAAVYVAVLFLPLVFAGLVWPAAAHWSKRLVETLAAIILSKFVIVAVLSLAAAGLAATGDQGQFQVILVGSVLFLLAAFAPYTLFRLIPVLETAAIHQFQGVGRGAISAAGAPASPASIYSSMMQSGSAGGDAAAPAAAEGGGAATSAAGGAAAAGSTAAAGAATAGAAVAVEAGVKTAGAVKDAGGRQVDAPASLAPGGGPPGSEGSGPAPGEAPSGPTPRAAPPPSSDGGPPPSSPEV